MANLFKKVGKFFNPSGELKTTKKRKFSKEPEIELNVKKRIDELTQELKHRYSSKEHYFTCLIELFSFLEVEPKKVGKSFKEVSEYCYRDDIISFKYNKNLLYLGIIYALSLRLENKLRPRLNEMLPAKITKPKKIKQPKEIDLSEISWEEKIEINNELREKITWILHSSFHYTICDEYGQFLPAYDSKENRWHSAFKINILKKYNLIEEIHNEINELLNIVLKEFEPEQKNEFLGEIFKLTNPQIIREEIDYFSEDAAFHYNNKIASTCTSSEYSEYKPFILSQIALENYFLKADETKNRASNYFLEEDGTRNRPSSAEIINIEKIKKHFSENNTKEFIIGQKKDTFFLIDKYTTYLNRPVEINIKCFPEVKELVPSTELASKIQLLTTELKPEIQNIRENLDSAISELKDKEESLNKQRKEIIEKLNKLKPFIDTGLLDLTENEKQIMNKYNFTFKLKE